MENIEYKMSYAMAKDLLKNKPNNLTPEQYLCKIVNETFGLKGCCVKVLIN